MKTKQEIEEKLKIYEQIRRKYSILTTTFQIAYGVEEALKWVLEIEEVDD